MSISSIIKKTLQPAAGMEERRKTAQKMAIITFIVSLALKITGALIMHCAHNPHAFQKINADMGTASFIMLMTGGGIAHAYRHCGNPFSRRKAEIEMNPICENPFSQQEIEENEEAVESADPVEEATVENTDPLEKGFDLKMEPSLSSQEEDD